MGELIEKPRPSTSLTRNSWTVWGHMLLSSIKEVKPIPWRAIPMNERFLEDYKPN